MTVATPESGGGAVQPYDPDNMAGLGLEDVGDADVTIPRISIDHQNGQFKNNLSGEAFPVLRAIFLGIVKQRIMWDAKVDDGDKPKCKSPDFENGFPNMNLDGKTPPNKQFPWAQSNFNPADFPPDQGLNGLVTLPCASCIFKEWDKGDWKQPPCNEQHTYPLLYATEEGASVENEGAWMPALWSTSKTGIKPSRTYLNLFVQSKSPMFTVVTEVSLQQQSRGTVTYSVPRFVKREATEVTSWGEFGQRYRSIREFIRQPPRRQDEEGDAPSAPTDNVNRGPDPTPAPAATAPVAQPAAATPPAPATTAPAAPAPEASPVADSSTASAPASPATPAPQSSAPAAADDDLPF